MENTYFYEPCRGHGLPHSPLKAIVAPRPIGWISTVDRNGRVNLAPYSFFNLFCDAPPIIVFSSDGQKDTLRNVESTGEFVTSVATYKLAQQMNVTAARVPYGQDEMKLAGLDPAASIIVKPPRVAAAPAALECRAISIQQLRDTKGRQLKSHLVLGEVVGVHLDRAYLRNGLFDTAAAGNLGRCGYSGLYCVADALFEMTRSDQAGAAT